MSKLATLRVCASCEWIFKGYFGCPQCGFASYGARYVYGNICYSFAKTQKPWLDKKMANASCEFYKIIRESQEKTAKERCTLSFSS